MADDLNEIIQRAHEEGKKKFAAMSESEQIGRLLSRRSDLQEEIQDAGRRVKYFGDPTRPGDFDREARDGNQAVVDRATSDLRHLDADLARRGVTNIEQEKRDYLDRTGRHRQR